MKSITSFMSRSISSKYFYLFLLCGIVVAFLFILFSSLTGILMGFISTLAIPGSFLLVIFFIIPGYLTARQLVIRDIMDKKYLLLLSVVFSSLIAYIVFWVYFLNNIVGQVMSVIITIVCAIIVVVRFKKLKAEILDEDFIAPLTLMFFVGCMYLGILFLHDLYDIYFYSSVANDRFGPSLPADNVLPLWFLERAYYGEPLTGFLDDWLASDRPPLFSAMLIIIRPLAGFMDWTMFYQFVGTFIQCLWIPALYSLCKFFNFDNKIRNFIIASAVFSGVFVINSTFLWPKFSATLFFTLLFLMVFELSERKKITKNSMIISIIIGICAALAFLSHGGIAFSFLALGLALIITEKRMNYIKHAAGAIASFIVIYLPWTLYQRFADPPGNRLSKEHLAGVIGANDYSLLEALHIGYSERTVGQLADKTIANIFTMFADFPNAYTSLAALRDTAFTRTFGTTFFLNAFLIILVLYFIKKYCIEQKQMGYKNKIMFYFTVFSFALWPLLMMTWNQTIIHQGSYFNILLLFILIAFGAKHCNAQLRNVLFFLNIFLFFVLWVVNVEVNIFTAPFVMSSRMLAVMIVSAVLFFAYLFKGIGSGEKVEEL